MEEASGTVSRWDRAAVAVGGALLALAIGSWLLPLDGRSEALRRLVSLAPLVLAPAAAGLLVPALRRRPAVLAALLSLTAAGVHFAYFLRPDGAAAWEGDALWFHRMAEEWPWKPGGWWRYRILVPWVVHRMPVAANVGYFAVGLLSVAAVGPLLSLLLRDLGYGPAARNAGVVLYLASFAPLYNAYNYALPDPAAMAVLLLAARALARDRDREFALWLLVGCVTKEVVLFLVPAHWLWRKSAGWDGKRLLRTMLVAAPAGLLFLGLRAAPEEARELSGFVTGNAWLFPWKHQPDNVARLYSPFAAGWALVALAALRPDRWARAGAGFAVLAGSSLLVTDAGRMLVYLLPFAVPMMLSAAGARPGLSPAGRGLLVLGLAALSMRLWEPFLVLWAVPVEVRRPAALLLAPAVLWLAWPLRREAPGA